jgi:ABC-2 type transport system ATP-binding protein
VRAAISTTRLTCRYGAAVAVREADLRVPAGSLFGLLGPNGAGKTTCLNVITTILPPSSGQVEVCGHDAVRSADAVRRCIGYAPEEPVVYSGLTAREFLELSAILHGLGRAEGVEAARSWLEQFGLADRSGDQIGSFSKGMRRKVLIAAALVHDPEVLVLDEPLEGLDVLAQDRLKDLLRQRTAAGKTVIYSTHTIEVVDGLCSHVALLAKGQVRAQGTVEEVRSALGVATLVDAVRHPTLWT